MTKATRFFIVQHIADVFRREGRNVGVIVQKNGDVSGRFLGERPDSQGLDGRVIKTLPHPDVYRQWVEYWQRVIARHSTDLEAHLTRSNGAHYNVIPGGEVEGTGYDGAKEVCAYLYSLLVTEGGLREALGTTIDEPEGLENLKRDILFEFRNLQILGYEPTIFARWPIAVDQEVRGAKTWHPVSYVQKSDRATWLMEPINFATPQKTIAKDHAGWTSLIFEDVLLAAQDRPVFPIALVRARESDWVHKTVEYSISLLLDRGAQVVNWHSAQEKERFLDERRIIALSGDLPS